MTYKPKSGGARAFGVHVSDLRRVGSWSPKRILADKTVYKKCLTCHRWFNDAAAHERACHKKKVSRSARRS